MAQDPAGAHRKAAHDAATHTARALAATRLINDPALRAAALCQERAAAEQHLQRVIEETRAVAVARYRAGERKRAVCTALGVSRPTLDKWLAEADGPTP